MTVTAPARRPTAAGRRAGYVVAIAINAVLLYLLDVWPGWAAVPFLTPATAQVIGLVTASLAVSVVVNAVYLFADPPAVRAAGDLLTTAIGVVVMVRLLRVFPFDFGASTVDWAQVVRVLLWVGVVAGSVALLVHAVRLVRALARHRPAGQSRVTRNM